MHSRRNTPPGLLMAWFKNTSVNLIIVQPESAEKKGALRWEKREDTKSA
ncbi:MAG: hypothetical protein Q6373_024985 [Candidatus Sigynarchaeota archaeon]